MKQSGSMVSAGGGEPPAGSAWLKAAALALVVAALGLPLDHLLGYAVALVAAVIIFSGEVSPLPARWAVALAIVVLSALAQSWVSPPRIDEGGNVFLPESQGALRAGLPSDVYDTLLRQFDAQYPPLSRCATSKCWEADERPDRLYAFSADGVLTRAPLSRSVTSIDFSDPIWLRLGFTNEFRYNWSGGNANGLERNHRDGRFWMGLHRWHLLMPWFVSYQFPAAYVGSTLCWNGTVLWEGDNQRFATFSGDAETCRNIASVDIGRRVVGIAIKPDTLAMRLERSWGLRLRSAVQGALALFGVLVVVAGLVRWRAQRLILPLSLIGLALVVIAIDDASFIGGVRPFDGGDDGLFYDGVGRAILQHVLACDFAAALEGGEKVYFYGGPGLRYFRALEHLVFGETYLGYLSLVLVLVFAALALFRRFLPQRWALALILLFVAIPVGVLFGTSFVEYEQWASRGFADPAAYILFICGLVVLLGTRRDCQTAFFGALLVALGIFMKPIIALAAAVLMGGVGLAALWQRQWPRLVGICIGFSFVLGMGLHNWIFGHVLVPFSANATHPWVYVMPPDAYVAAFWELAGFHPGGEHVLRAVVQLADWLSGPSQLRVMIPLHAGAIVIVAYVTFRARGLDPWLRLVAGAALAQHVVALFYVATARYHFIAWFLTMLVCAVWLHEIGVPWLQRHYPKACARLAELPSSVRLASGLTWLERVSA